MYSKLKFWCKKVVDSVPGRLVILAFAAYAGYQFWLHCYDAAIHKLGLAKIENYFTPLPFTLPPALCIWYFRTRDKLHDLANAEKQLSNASQQIVNTNIQIQQGVFTAGLDKILQSDPMTIEAGVKMLLRVSERTDAFDDEIREAFIKRIKEMPAMPDVAEPLDPSAGASDEDEKKVELAIPPRLTYAQYILQWLIAKQKHYAEKPNLRGMRCDYQEFKVSGLDLVKILPTPSEVKSIVSDHHWLRTAAGVHWVASFMNADCDTLNFDGVARGILLIEGYINITLDGKSFQSSSTTL